MWPGVNSSSCREQNAATAPQARGATGCEGIVGTGLLCPAWERISLGQETSGMPGTSAGPRPIAVCLP